MKTLIETKTGKVVNAGDVITLDGTAHILTDFDVPGLVGRGILTFMCDKPSKKATDTQTTPEVNKTDIPTVGTDSDIDERSFAKIVEFKNPKLEAIMLNWGYEKGLGNKEQIYMAISLLHHFCPQSLLHIALKALAVEVNEYYTLSAGQIGWAFSLVDMDVVPVRFDRPIGLDDTLVAIFDSKEAALDAKAICQELIYDLINGE